MLYSPDKQNMSTGEKDISGLPDSHFKSDKSINFLGTLQSTQNIKKPNLRDTHMKQQASMLNDNNYFKALATLLYGNTV